jgi:predicted membrane-bound spermidine synthase
LANIFSVSTGIRMVPKDTARSRRRILNLGGDYILLTHLLILKSLFLSNAAKDVRLPKTSFLLALSFIEGACVMVAELAGGKMLAPFYGTSLYVWASTLAITLGGLTAGYYVGGRLSKKSLAERKKILFLTLALAAALVIIMPVWGSFIMSRTMDMEFLTGLVISQASFLFLPIFGMGMVSPLIIGLLGETRNSGSAAGSVYAISTLGGIIATLLTGFWLVPVVGISLPCMVSGALLLIAALVVLRPDQKVGALLLLAIFPTMLFVKDGHDRESGKFDLLYYSEGILGQVKVLEFKTQKQGKEITTMNLLVNHNWQTWIDKDNPTFSFLIYTRFTNAIIASLPKGSSALLIGLGGGTVAKQLEAHGISYDAVEIDGRLPALAKKYFGLKGTGNLVVDDGRHYINKCKKKYDLVIIDALLGENVPSHLLSIECFEKIKQLLKGNGKIFIEFDGIEEGDEGTAQRIVYNSLKAAGYGCTVFSSVPGNLASDIMYLAAVGREPDTTNITLSKDLYFEHEGSLSTFSATLSSNSSIELRDNTPSLDYYLKKRMAYVRNDVLKKMNMAFMEDDLLFYY